MPFDRVDREYPYLDEEIMSMVYGHVTAPDGTDMLISVTPMIFNDRIMVTPRPEYPNSIVAGFCYDKGPLAGICAIAWVECWDELDVPPGFKKEALNWLPRYGKGN